MSSMARVIFLVDCTDLMRRRRTRSLPPATSDRLVVPVDLLFREDGLRPATGESTLRVGLGLGVGLVGASAARGLELVGEALDGGLEGRDVLDVTGAHDAVEHVAVASTEPFEELGLEAGHVFDGRSEEHTSELQSLMRI